MKREIVCPQCREGWSMMIGKYPGEYIKIVDGKLLKPCCCDDCNDDLPVDEKASAVSLYTSERPYSAWEHEYLLISGKA